jgi:hypothetical protein
MKGEFVSGQESDYLDYQIAKDNEGGLHTGRSTPSRAMLWTLLIVVVVLVLGILALTML